VQTLCLGENLQTRLQRGLENQKVALIFMRIDLKRTLLLGDLFFDFPYIDFIQTPP
jgi:hypothetical protein